MTTGNVADWNGNMADLGPLYPFVGWEWGMVIVLLVLWIGWHLWQMKMESNKLEDCARHLRQGDNLHKAAMSERSVERM